MMKSEMPAEPVDQKKKRLGSRVRVIGDRTGDVLVPGVLHCVLADREQLHFLCFALRFALVLALGFGLGFSAGFVLPQ